MRTMDTCTCTRCIGLQDAEDMLCLALWRTHNALLEQPAVDVICALASLSLLNNDGHE